MESYTYIDVAVRRQLSEVGKAVHKFLSRQPNEYAISLEIIDGPRGLLGQPKRIQTCDVWRSQLRSANLKR